MTWNRPLPGATEEIAIQKMLDEHGCGAYTNTFEDLWGMEQLPGIASQDLMAKGSATAARATGRYPR